MGPPAKKKRRYEYAPELKAKTREELVVYFESFTGRLGDGFFCGFGQCNPATKISRKGALTQHIRNHINEVLETNAAHLKTHKNSQLIVLCFCFFEIFKTVIIKNDKKTLKTPENLKIN